MYRLLLPLLFSALPACGPASRPPPAAPLRLTDGLGRVVVLPAPPRRVLGLTPAMTEILFFVCDTAQVVGVTPNDNFPSAASHKPKVSTYPLDLEGILLLRPDLAFTSEGMTSPADAQRLQQMDTPVFFQRYQTVDDLLRGIEEVGRLTGHATRAVAKVDSLRRRLRALEVSGRALPRPRVLAITWQDPIYAYGKNTLLTDKLRLAGAVNAIDTTFAVPFPALTREYILKLNPDVILGYSFARMDSTFFRLYPELRRTNAYRTRRVFAVTDDLNSRPSPRVVEAVEELRRLLHPNP